MAQFIEDEGISEERRWYEWLSCVKNRAKFKMPYSPICDEYLRHRAEVMKGDQILIVSRKVREMANHSWRGFLI